MILLIVSALLYLLVYSHETAVFGAWYFSRKPSLACRGFNIIHHSRLRVKYNQSFRTEPVDKKLTAFTKESCPEISSMNFISQNALFMTRGCLCLFTMPVLCDPSRKHLTRLNQNGMEWSLNIHVRWPTSTILFYSSCQPLPAIASSIWSIFFKPLSLCRRWRIICQSRCFPTNGTSCSFVIDDHFWNYF